PDDLGAPPQCIERSDLFNVAFNRPAEFRFPKGAPRSGHGGARASFVAVPETAVNKDYEPVLRQHDIRASGQVEAMQTEAPPHRMEGAAHKMLGLGVAPFHAPHILAAPFGVEM